MMKEKLEILFEDNDLVAVMKPAGMLSVPDRFLKKVPSVSKELEQKYGEIFIIHRLDKETSGVLLFAKNADAHRHLNMQFEKHTMRKQYHAVVEGVFPNEDDMAIDIPIMAHPSKRGLSAPSGRGKESLTIVRRLKRFKTATLLECDLYTGRHHQIRVHLSAVGYPLFVDKDYGNNTEFMLSSIKRKFNMKKDDDERPTISRQTLHAKFLEFDHPQTGERVSVEAPYPKDFDVLVKLLSKYSTLNI